MKSGKLIVIDGGDGSGKTVQAKLLVNYLKKNKIPTKYLDFPQYYKTFFGKMVGRLMRGDFGDINSISPYLASLTYAFDRLAVKKEIEKFLNNGGYIIANRYVTSNLAHQGAKFTDLKKQAEFINWVSELEYRVNKLPKEDLVIYLFVPWQIGLKLSQLKVAREYLAGKTDIHEKDLNHRREVEKLYLNLARKNKHWITLICTEKGKLLPPQKIHAKIISLLQGKGVIDKSQKIPL